VIRRLLLAALALALLAASGVVLVDQTASASAPRRQARHGHHAKHHAARHHHHHTKQKHHKKRPKHRTRHHAGQATDPRLTRGLFVDPLMPAAQQGGAYAGIGAQAQALWLTEYYPISGVQAAVRAYTSRAEQAGKTPILAVYAIPDRDCGGYSSGGEPSPAAYRSWLSQAAAGMKGSDPLVVLEPDALPFLGACAGQGPRTQLLSWAVQQLDQAGAWVYLDAGHDGWQSAAVMAQRLKAAGVARARGFSLNVGNYRPTAAEQTYANQVLADLAGLGVKGSHYVIETARNGAPNPVDGDVCNPVWARLGRPPQLLFQGAYDGGLWIKHPGESDGPCNGGPSSGQWSDLLADRLLGRAG
jgi:endoglucanase